MSQSNWFLTPHPRPNADLKLICFPYAGGNASTYLPWSEFLPKNVELNAIQLPGRANRMLEPNHSDMNSLIRELLMVIPIVTDRPYILFGHSLGCKIAFELMIQYQRKGLRLPQHFIASGSVGPDIPTRIASIYDLPDKDFIKELKELKGTPKEIIENEELMSLCLPTLRSDFELSDTYLHSSNTVIDCPISLFTGEKDNDITLLDLKSWEKYFLYSMKLHTFPGDHFFIESDKNLVLQKVILIIKEALTELKRLT